MATRIIRKTRRRRDDPIRYGTSDWYVAHHARIGGRYYIRRDYENDIGGTFTSNGTGVFATAIRLDRNPSAAERIRSTEAICRYFAIDDRKITCDKTGNGFGEAYSYCKGLKVYPLSRNPCPRNSRGSDGVWEVAFALLMPITVEASSSIKGKKTDLVVFNMRLSLCFLLAFGATLLACQCVHRVLLMSFSIQKIVYKNKVVFDCYF